MAGMIEKGCNGQKSGFLCYDGLGHVAGADRHDQGQGQGRQICAVLTADLKIAFLHAEAVAKFPELLEAPQLFDFTIILSRLRPACRGHCAVLQAGGGCSKRAVWKVMGRVDRCLLHCCQHRRGAAELFN